MSARRGPSSCRRSDGDRMPESLPQTANLCKFGLTNANHFALSYLRQPARALTRTRRGVATVAFCPAHGVTIGPRGCPFLRRPTCPPFWWRTFATPCVGGVSTASHCPSLAMVLPWFCQPSERRIRYTLGPVLDYCRNAPAAAPEAFPAIVDRSVCRHASEGRTQPPC